MKRVGFISLGNLYLCPYLQAYLHELEQPYTVIFWDREQRMEEPPAGCTYFRFESTKLVSTMDKLHGYRSFRRYIKRILKEHSFDVLVLLQTAAAVLISDILVKEYPNRYIVDIRDYSVEGNPLLFRIEKNIISHSMQTVISSEGYKSFLPERPYLIAHNLQRLSNEKVAEIRKSSVRKEQLNIAFIGYVNYHEQHKKILLQLKNDPRFHLTFIGTRAEELSSFCNANGINNVTLRGRFEPDDILGLYQSVNLINNLYGNHTPTLDYALSNKLYFAAELHIPILVCPGTFMESVSKQYHIGCTVDLDKPGAADVIYSFYNNIAWDEFKAGCTMFLNKVKNEQAVFTSTVKKAFSEATD